MSTKISYTVLLALILCQFTAIDQALAMSCFTAFARKIPYLSVFLPLNLPENRGLPNEILPIDEGTEAEILAALTVASKVLRLNSFRNGWVSVENNPLSYDPELLIGREIAGVSVELLEGSKEGDWWPQIRIYVGKVVGVSPSADGGSPYLFVQHSKGQMKIRFFPRSIKYIQPT